MVYISTKLLESNGIVTFSTPTKKEDVSIYDTPYKNPMLNPMLPYCPTALDVKIGNSIKKYNDVYNDVLGDVTAVIQSTKNAAINRQILEQDHVFYYSKIEDIVSDQKNYEDWVTTSFDLGLINNWTAKRFFGQGDIQYGHQKQFVFKSTLECVDLIPQSNQIALQYDLTKDDNEPLIICAKYLTVVGAILTNSVNSTISTTKDIGYLFERKKTTDDRYFVVIDPKLISRENRYYTSFTISLSISEEDFEFSKIAGSDGVHENCVIEAPSNTSCQNICPTNGMPAYFSYLPPCNEPCLPLEPCSSYGSYRCNNNSLFRFKTFKPVSNSILLNDGTSVKTFDGYDSVSGCWANVTQNEQNSVTTNIQNLHHSLNIAESVDVRRYVTNAETLKDSCGNIISGIIMSDSDGNVWYTRSGVDSFDVPEVNGSISTTSAPPSSGKKTSALPPPASTNTVLNSKINQTSLGLQSNMQSKPVGPILQESSVKPPCDCGY